jgi:hypothetical protein
VSSRIDHGPSRQGFGHFENSCPDLAPDGNDLSERQQGNPPSEIRTMNLKTLVITLLLGTTSIAAAYPGERGDRIERRERRIERELRFERMRQERLAREREMARLRELERERRIEREIRERRRMERDQRRVEREERRLERRGWRRRF